MGFFAERTSDVRTTDARPAGETRPFDPDRPLWRDVRQEAPEASETTELNTFDPDRMMDGHATPYARRRIPDTLATFTDTPGESKAVPNTETDAGRKAASKLAEYGIDGIEYQDRYPNFSPCSEATVAIDNMTDSLYDNYRQADAKCAEKWNAEGRNGRNDWTAADVRDHRREKDLTWHECEDLTTCQLVPREIHDAFRHSGGRCEYKYQHGLAGGFDE